MFETRSIVVGPHGCTQTLERGANLAGDDGRVVVEGEGGQRLEELSKSLEGSSASGHSCARRKSVRTSRRCTTRFRAAMWLEVALPGPRNATSSTECRRWYPGGTSLELLALL